MINFRITEAQHNLIKTAIREVMKDNESLLLMDDQRRINNDILKLIKDEYISLCWHVSASDITPQCTALANNDIDLDIAVRLAIKDYMTPPKAITLWKPTTNRVTDVVAKVSDVINKHYREGTDWVDSARKEVEKLGEMAIMIFEWSIQ